MLRAGVAGALETARILLYETFAARGGDKTEGDGGRVAVVQGHDPMLDSLAKTLSSAKTRGLPLEVRLPPPSGDTLSARAASRLRGAEVVMAALPSGGSGLEALAACRQEAAFQDLAVAEPALERVLADRSKGVPGREEQAALLERLLPHLEEGVPPGAGGWDALRDYGFLLLKPWLAVLDSGQGGAEPTLAVLAEAGVPALAVDLAAEAEIAALEPQDANEFLADMGVEEPAADRIVRAAYAAANQVVFYTGNRNEARAWSVAAGTNAQGAAAAIHADIGRGFVRAEVMRAADLVRLGSEQAVKDAGLWRLQGKDYLVASGDYLGIRHT